MVHLNSRQREGAASAHAQWFPNPRGVTWLHYMAIFDYYYYYFNL